MTEETTTTTPDAPADAEATSAAPAAPIAQSQPSAINRTPPDGHWWWGTGRRKSAIARVRIRPGKGEFQINKRPLEQYFTEERDRKDILNVLKATNTHGTVDVFVNATGGGFTGQAGAIVLGIARALRRYDESLMPILRDNDFLTRDPREVERKKYGQPGARKRFQFSKR